MKSYIIILGVLLLSLSFISAASIPVYVRPQSNGNLLFGKIVTYRFDFTTDSACSNVIFSHSETVQTDSQTADAFINISTPSNATPEINYICEYVDGDLRIAHQPSDALFTNLYANLGHFKNVNVTTNLTVGKQRGIIHAPDNVHDINTSGAIRFYTDVNNPASIAYMFCAENPNGDCLPRLVIQRGGNNLGSLIVRSFGVINDNRSWLNGTASNGVPTNLTAYLDYVGDEAKIDFQTSVTGADFLVSDDMQVVGDFYAKDTDGEYHFITREFELLDENRDNSVLSRLNVSLTDNNLTILELEGSNIVVNIQESNVILDRDADSILLTEGTNASPEFNHIYYDTATNPVLTKSSIEESKKADVFEGMIGNGFSYGSIGGSANQYEFTRNVYRRFFDDGPIYKSGFNITTDSDTLSFSTGTMKILIEDLNINTAHSTDDLAVEILSDGTYEQHSTNLNGFDLYGDGGTIGNNKYFNVVCGVAATHDANGVMYCIVQNEPSTEFTKTIDTELDQTYVQFFPNDAFIKKLYTPIARIVLQRSGGVNTIQTLSNGENYLDLRGRISGGGSPPTPSITNHSDLTGQEFSSSGHTFAELLQILNVGAYNVTTNESITASWFYGDGFGITNLNEQDPVANSTGLIQNWNKTGHITNENATELILNWSRIINGTGYVIDWNDTGFIRDWRSEINDTGVLANYNASGHIQNYNATGFISRDRLQRNNTYNENSNWGANQIQVETLNITGRIQAEIPFRIVVGLPDDLKDIWLGNHNKNLFYRNVELNFSNGRYYNLTGANYVFSQFFEIETPGGLFRISNETDDIFYDSIGSQIFRIASTDVLTIASDVITFAQDLNLGGKNIEAADTVKALNIEGRHTNATTNATGFFVDGISIWQNETKIEQHWDARWSNVNLHYGSRNIAASSYIAMIVPTSADYGFIAPYNGSLNYLSYSGIVGTVPAGGGSNWTITIKVDGVTQATFDQTFNNSVSPFEGELRVPTGTVNFTNGQTINAYVTEEFPAHGTTLSTLHVDIGGIYYRKD